MHSNAAGEEAKHIRQRAHTNKFDKTVKSDGIPAKDV